MSKDRSTLFPPVRERRVTSPAPPCPLAPGALRGQNAPLFEGALMHRVLILGAGKIGALISGLLAESGSYKVQLADVAGGAAEGVVRGHGTGSRAPFALDGTVAGAVPPCLG